MIEVNTFNFLRDLAAHNDREWFALNKEKHDIAKENLINFTSKIITGLSKIDKAIPPDINPKNCVMRIYRDVRFSLDKTPYKTNFAAGISPNGKNFNGPGYYLHINPQECFIAGGYWMPEVNHLRLIRQEIDYNPAVFKESLKLLSKINPKACLDKNHTLKTAPKGYSPDHPEIEFIKLKSFTVTVPIKYRELMAPGAETKVLNGFASIYPFILFLRNALSH
ncbi:MAG: DUF2461 domain-containing protein [Flavobacterium sp.]|nr:DUF2461 domain-containing protein [Pedobacter sp.]